MLQIHFFNATPLLFYITNHFTLKSSLGSQYIVAYYYATDGSK